MERQEARGLWQGDHTGISVLDPGSLREESLRIEETQVLPTPPQGPGELLCVPVADEVISGEHAR